MLTFVVDTRQDDVLGITRLLHVALAWFGWGVVGFDADGSLWMLGNLGSRDCSMWP